MANPLVLAGSGAAAGVLVGGPVGAAIGAGVGLLLGLAGGKDEPRGTTPARRPAQTQANVPGTNAPPANVDSPTGTPPNVPVTEEELILEADKQNVDPATVVVGKDGSYQGEDMDSGVTRVLFADDVVDPNTGRYIPAKVSGAAADMEQRREVYYDTACAGGGLDASGSCVTSILYETCREYPGSTHESCADLTSRHSYEYRRYGGGGLSEEDASWFPLDADVDKATAFANQKASELNRLAGGDDVQLCSYDWEAGLGGKCLGGIVSCDSDFFCGDGNWCRHAPTGDTECLPKDRQMRVCMHKDKWGRQNVYPQGMTHGQAMLDGLCPMPNTYMTPGERYAAEQAAAQQATTQGAVSAVQATPTAPEPAPLTGSAGMDALEQLGVQAVDDSTAARLLSQGSAAAIASNLATAANSIGAGLSTSELLAGASSSQSTQGTVGDLVDFLGKTDVSGVTSKRRGKRGNGGGYVSPIAFYMGLGR